MRQDLIVTIKYLAQKGDVEGIKTAFETWKAWQAARGVPAKPVAKPAASVVTEEPVSEEPAVTPTNIDDAIKLLINPNGSKHLGGTPEQRKAALNIVTAKANKMTVLKKTQGYHRTKPWDSYL
jgi:hypothetical protein